MFFLWPLCLFGQWAAIDTGMTKYGSKDFLKWNNKLYLLGSHIVNGDTVCGIASYDGNNFDEPMPPGFGAFTGLVENGDFYIGGHGGVKDCKDTQQPWPGTGGIVKWNGAWNSIGGGGNGGNEEVNAVAMYKGELYVGGTIFSMGGVPVYKIARWNGSQWKAVGPGFYGNTQVNAMAVYKGELYVGGNISIPNGPNNYYYQMARWNGTKWDSVGGQFGPGEVSSLCVDTINDLLYIGGGLNFAGNLPVRCVVQWDGTNLSAPGFCPTNGAIAMAMYNNKLYVGGLATAGTVNDTIIAAWDGNYWCPMVPGPNEKVSALEEYQGKLYLSGEFSQVDTISATRLATWGGNECPTAGVSNTETSLQVNIYPNPVKAELNIQIIESGNGYILKIYNSTGGIVLERDIQGQASISTSGFSKGVYQVRVCKVQSNTCHTEIVIIQ